MDKQNKEHGEGNYKASRDYNEATKRFVESGKVDEAAQKAKPKNAREEQQMQEAEKIGKRRSKGEDADPDLLAEEEESVDEDAEEDDLPRSDRD